MKRARVLEKLEALGIPTGDLLWRIENAVSEAMTKQTRKTLKKYRARLIRRANRLDKLRRERNAERVMGDIQILVLVDMMDRVPAWDLPLIPPPDPLIGVAASMRREREEIGDYVKHFGLADLSLVSLVDWILLRNKEFDSWSLVAILLNGPESRDLRRIAATIRKVREAQSKGGSNGQSS